MITQGRKISNGVKKRLLSGVKPTGEIHIGNYFGAMKQFVDLQDSHMFRIHILHDTFESWR